MSEAFSSLARWAVYAGGQAVQEDSLDGEDGTDMLYRNVGNHLMTYRVLCPISQHWEDLTYTEAEALTLEH
jgi:hypothetical protein